MLFIGHRGNQRFGEAPSLRAYDKATGEMIWKMDLPLGPSTPMTYLHQGRQYVVMATGGGAQAEVIALALPAPANSQ